MKKYLLWGMLWVLLLWACADPAENGPGVEQTFQETAADILLPGTGELLRSVPAGYYATAAGKTGAELKAALHNIIDDHRSVSYTTVWTALKELDEDPANSNNVLLLYTRRSHPKSDNGGGVDQWNREHSWPKSHGFPTSSWPAYTDLHHLRATDVSVNSTRGNKDFDLGGSIISEAPQCRTTASTFEPPDVVKGDIARMMFYMAVRYEGDKSNEPNLELVDDPAATDTGKPHLANLKTLLAWHAQDPVSAEEMARNEKVYANWQGNRNPFIDNPGYVAAIWGGSSGGGQTWQQKSVSVTSPGYPSNYSNNAYADFTLTEPGAAKVRLHFAAFNLESGYDFVNIYDGDLNQLASYTGSKGAFTGVEVPGDTVIVEFSSDYSVTAQGFSIDRLEFFK